MTVMEECSRQIAEATGKQKEKVNKVVIQRVDMTIVDQRQICRLSIKGRYICQLSTKSRYVDYQPSWQKFRLSTKCRYEDCQPWLIMSIFYHEQKCRLSTNGRNVDCPPRVDMYIVDQRQIKDKSIVDQDFIR